MSWPPPHAVVIGATSGLGSQRSVHLRSYGTVVHDLDLDSGFDATDLHQCSAF